MFLAICGFLLIASAGIFVSYLACIPGLALAFIGLFLFRKEKNMKRKVVGAVIGIVIAGACVVAAKTTGNDLWGFGMLAGLAVFFGSVL